ncbi:MAG: RNA polymerase sigma factor [Christensenellales bacterium]
MTSLEDYSSVVESLYDRFAGDVLRVSYFYLGDRSKAEDVTQDVFLRLMDSKPVLKEGSEKSWLLKVALNLCRDLWRSAWARRVILGSRKLELIPASDQIDKRLEKEALMQAIHSLPPEIREVFLLHYYQGYGIDEISRLLDTPPGTISSRLSRGRTKLRNLFKEDESL